MDPAQETAARIGIDETTAHALEALRWNWGSAYEIETEGETWRARRLDGLGGWMEAESTEALRIQIVRDYMTRPVDWQARVPQPGSTPAPGLDSPGRMTVAAPGRTRQPRV